jgi:chloramphenicol 3-O phosphotransferase
VRPNAAHDLAPELVPVELLGPGRIVFLNGTSSSGKSSLAKALLTVLEGNWCHMSVDAFRAVRSPIQTTSQQRDADTQRTVLGFHRAIAGFASVGNNVIVDQVLGERWRLNDCLEVFKPYDLVFVGVHCPLPELERREARRPGRTAGRAAFQFDVVHAHGAYDLELDTSRWGPEACALIVKDYLDGGAARPRAFDILRGFALPG